MLDTINTNPPHLMHIDINSCFATVTQQASYHLRGKPLVIAAYASPKGCVLSPSIEAKKFGIKTGMRVFEAKNLCPFVIVRETDTGLIRDVHHKLKKLLDTYSPDVIPKSIDEFVINFSSMKKYLLKQNLADIANCIKKDIHTKVGDWISVSIGIATNRFLAKLASGLHKPNGLDVITYKNMLDVYRSINITDFPGINIRYQLRLARFNIVTPLDLFRVSAVTLKKQVFQSIIGYQWYMRLRGFETDNVEFQTKSFGQDYALLRKTDDKEELKRLLLKLCEKMGRRLRKHGYQAQGVHVGFSYIDGTYWHQGRRLPHPIFATYELYEAAKHQFDQQPVKKIVTKIMVHCYDLLSNNTVQEPLFDIENKRQKVSKALDAVNDRFGEFTVIPATMLGMNKTIVERIAFGKAGMGI